MKLAAAILSFFVLPLAEGGEMASVGADGRMMQLRFTRSSVTADRFVSSMEVSMDGGDNWQPGNHQVFKRAATGGGSGGGLRFRKRQQPYVPLT